MFTNKTITIVAAAAAAAALAVFAGPSQGSSSLPISSCGQIVTTSAVLTQDLTCPADYGVLVAASGVTIDLNGHVLKGGGFWTGVDLASYDDITIQNGVIRGFGKGLDTGGGADHITISNVVASGNVNQGIRIAGDSASVKSSTASGNGQSGFQIVGDSTSIKSSAADGNGFDGIWVDGTSASVSSSRASGNSSTGVYVFGSSATVKSTKAAGNDGHGIQVLGDAPSVRSSTASGNGAIGIVVSGDRATIKGNHAEANGFWLGGSDGVGAGIVAVGYTTPPTGTNVARGNDDQADCQPSSLCPVSSSQSVKNGWAPITTCAQSVTTNALLMKDLDCAGSGVVVGAGGITIDLNGHVLKGAGSSSGISDYLGHDRVVIKNGVVRNFFDGIHAASNADDVKVSNVVASGNVNDGVYLAGASASISSSTAAGNVGIGLLVMGDSASIASSNASGNGGYGIANTGDGTSIKSSSSTGNTGSGISVKGASITLVSSITSGNGAAGLSLTGASPSVKSVVATGNRSIGISLWGDGVVLNGNRADGNGFSGGSSDGWGLGIEVGGFTTTPLGTNDARGNDEAAECSPASLCS
jgi:trimeric autotransporter adhesin